MEEEHGVQDTYDALASVLPRVLVVSRRHTRKNKVRCVSLLRFVANGICCQRIVLTVCSLWILWANTTWI